MPVTITPIANHSPLSMYVEQDDSCDVSDFDGPDDFEGLDDFDGVDDFEGVDDFDGPDDFDDVEGHAEVDICSDLDNSTSSGAPQDVDEDRMLPRSAPSTPSHAPSHGRRRAQSRGNSSTAERRLGAVSPLRNPLRLRKDDPDPSPVGDPGVRFQPVGCSHRPGPLQRARAGRNLPGAHTSWDRQMQRHCRPLSALKPRPVPC